MNRRVFLAAAGGCLAALRGDAFERLESETRAIREKSVEEAARDEDFWFQVRHAFTIDRNSINLNSGSVSPRRGRSRRSCINIGTSPT
jgi:hypothetical protein